MPNINTKTGISFGSIDARKAMDLYDEITREGVNTTLTDAEDDVKTRLASELADIDGTALYVEHGLDKDLDDAPKEEQKRQYADRRDVLADELAGCIKRSTELSSNESARCSGRTVELCDVDSGTFSIPELVDGVMEYLNDHDYFSEIDEPIYDYESGGFVYHLSYMGGAPMIWVYSGPYATYCQTCSPCCPNAGDNDNFTDEDHGNCFSYCLDPADIDDDEDKPVVLYSVDAEGNAEKLPYTKEPHADAN